MLVFTLSFAVDFLVKEFFNNVLFKIIKRKDIWIFTKNFFVCKAAKQLFDSNSNYLNLLCFNY